LRAVANTATTTIKLANSVIIVTTEMISKPFAKHQNDMPFACSVYGNASWNERCTDAIYIEKL
jgi:hypothetical protein